MASPTTSGPSSQGPGAGNAAAAQSTGVNPQDRTDGAGNATSVHAAPSLSDGFNAPSDMTFASESDANMNVRILHDRSNPLEIAGTPTEAALYTVIPGTQCSTDPSVHTVMHQQGDLASPEIASELDANTLFIDGAPTPADIRQVGFADCYFMASLIQLINQDPGHIQRAITGGAGGITATLYRYDASGATPTWTPTSISTDNTLAHEVDSAGNQGGLIGASFRVADQPKMSKWWCEMVGNTMVLHRDDTYEGALWAPLLEKCYARFIEQHGQYGGFDPTNAHSGNAGYQDINGGIAQYSYYILYGNNATVGGTQVNYQPGADVVTSNLAAIRNMLQVMGDGVPAGQRFMMTAMISPDESVNRLNALAGSIVNNPTSQSYPTLRTHLQKLQQEILTWTNAAPADKAAKLATVTQRATNLATPGNWPLLHSPSAPKEYKDLNELCNVVMHLGTDSSSGQRMTYAWHSYAVEGATFRDSANADLAVTTSNLATMAPQISASNTSVRMRNPHGTNEPDEHGQQAAGTSRDGANEGAFNLSLDQFCRLFQWQQHGFVRT